MPSLVPHRAPNTPPALRQAGGRGGGHQSRPAKPPLAARAPGLIEGVNVVGAALPKLGLSVVYAGLAVAVLVWRAFFPIFQVPLWGFALYLWAVVGLVCIALYELVPFLWAIIGFRLRRRAEAWERQQIHEAQTYGDARQADWFEAHDALRGSAGGSPGARQVFDE